MSFVQNNSIEIDVVKRIVFGLPFLRHNGEGGDDDVIIA
jgi:hypothetical protein